MRHLRYRRRGYRLLSGHGVEVGAAWHPADLPDRCRVTCCDLRSRAELASIFEEVDSTLLAGIPETDLRLDLDVDGLRPFPDASQDFVIANHVLDQLANPLHALAEFSRVLKPGGRLMLSVVDRSRSASVQPLTPFSELERRFRSGASTPLPEDYMEIVRYIHPGLLSRPQDELEQHLGLFMRRREHLHAWSCATFREFLRQGFMLLGQRFRTVLQIDANDNLFECLSVLERDV